jgi:hypothetical protein
VIVPRANEGRRVQFERVSGQIITAPLINFDLPEKLAEFDGVDDRWPMRLEASGEIDTGEWQSLAKGVRLGIGDDLRAAEIRWIRVGWLTAFRIGERCPNSTRSMATRSKPGTVPAVVEIAYHAIIAGRRYPV